MNSYYDILNIKQNYTAFQLLLAYLKTSKVALKNNDKDLFEKCRQGYEVLRNEKSTGAYHRLFRKYILNKKLNYPAQKEKELKEIYQAQEKEATSYVESFTNGLPSFTSHLISTISKLILYDLIHVVTYGSSGLIIIAVGIWSMTTFSNNLNLYGGLSFIGLGLILARMNFKNYIIQIE